MENYDEVRDVVSIPFTAGFNWSVGLLMEKFIQALADKKILGSKCPQCGYVYVPPRTRCGTCCAKMSGENLVAVPAKGILTGFTTAHIQMDGAGKYVDLQQPAAIAAVKLEGADSTLFLPMAQCPLKDLAPGMPVEVKWRAETKGEIADLEYVKPLL